MGHQVRAGPARELDARNRAIFSAADGLGKLSESVVAPMLPHIILTPGMDMLKAMLSTQDGLPIASRSMVSVVRQWQLALELPAPDCVVLTSLRRVQQLLHLKRHTRCLPPRFSRCLRLRGLTPWLLANPCAVTVPPHGPQAEMVPRARGRSGTTMG